MTKSLITSFLFCFLASVAFGQQDQTGEDPFYYQISGLVYVKEFNTTTRAKTQTQKIPKEPLRFRIVSKEIDNTDNSTFYVIQFLRIKSESDETATITVDGKGKDKKITRTVTSTLIGSTEFVNSGDNSKYFWIRKDELDNYMTDGFIAKSYKTPNVNISYGANISLPFKLRTETNGQNIKITPDLTLGGYLGLKWRLSHTKPFYVTLPVVSLGLATLSINDNNNPTTPNKGDGTVLGITGSTGLVFQLSDFQFGLMLGWDRAAGEIGKDWIYNNKTWYSFSIGYSFLGNNSDKDKKK
jgi:hypothetical protein